MRKPFYKDVQWFFALLLGLIVCFVGGYFLNLEAGASAELTFQVFLFSVLLYPVLEEIVFRGGLQGWLLSKRSLSENIYFGITPANLISSLCFVGAHLIYQPLLWSLAVFFPSMVFGYFRERYDALFPSIALHALYNLGFLLFVI